MSDTFGSALLFGMPGVGKGTQGQLIGRIPGFCHVATGDMFRSLGRNSDLGRQVAQYSSKGLLVPDEVTIELFGRHIRAKIDRGEYDPARQMLLLDGIPRSVAQARALVDRVDVLIVLHLVSTDIDVMVERMKGRAIKQGRRDDADETVIRRRFEVYREETSPVLAEYDESLVADVDALGRPAEVLLRMLEKLVPAYANRFPSPFD